MATYKHHVCMSVRGALRWDRRYAKRMLKFVTKNDGTRFESIEEMRNAFVDELAQGHEVIPVGKPCDGFDYKTGCPGHPYETWPESVG